MKFKIILLATIGIVSIAVIVYFYGNFERTIKTENDPQQNNWTINYVLMQFPIIKKESGGIFLVEDGGINAWGVISKRVMNLSEGGEFELSVDHHGHTKARIDKINDNYFYLYYDSFFDHHSFGVNMVSEDTGTVEIPYTPEWAFVIYSGNISSLRSMLDDGFEFNSRDNYGRTPLLFAAYYGYPEMVKLLIERGANPSILNNYNTSIFEILSSKKSLFNYTVSNSDFFDLYDNRDGLLDNASVNLVRECFHKNSEMGQDIDKALRLYENCIGSRSNLNWSKRAEFDEISSLLAPYGYNNTG